MSFESQLEREENILEQQLADGSIDHATYTKELRDLHQSASYYLHEMAMEAYDDVLNHF